MPKHWVISADSHVVEPDDLYTKALKHKYGDQLPHMVESGPGGNVPHLYSGYEYLPVIGLFDVGNETQEKLKRANKDPALRLECLDQDGIYAEVMAPTTLMLTMRVPNDDLVRDCCSVFNAWLADYCSQAPKRLYGIAAVHMADVGLAVKELDRVIKRGMRAVMINTDARPGWPPYQDPVYEPFWARAQDAGIPVMLHIVAGNARDFFTLFGDERKHVARHVMGLFSDGQVTLGAEFIFGGIMDRFPNLKLVLGEYEVSWYPYWLFRMEQTEKEFLTMVGGYKPKQPVRRYMERVGQGVIDDPFADAALKLLDTNTVMWGSDFPHPRCTYPNSHQVIEANYARLGEDIMRKISLGNAARFYQIELPASVERVAAE